MLSSERGRAAGSEAGPTGAALPDGVQDADLAHFLDADMAILGAPPARFDAYERAIATEFAAVPADRFRAGRARFLQRVLALPRIYETEFFSSEAQDQFRYEPLDTGIQVGFPQRGG